MGAPTGRVLVMGADGFIGRHIAFELRAAGWDVLAVARRVGRLRAMAFAFLAPVVHLQIRIRNIAGDALARGAPLPDAAQRAFRLWFALGWPAFAALVGVSWLMVAKPEFWG
ncbi:MAG TPA: DUF2269 family protein [Aliiroseovarius sp.]|nr:DUF2269 family protein [Aliiroseovarius sp.]